MESAGIEACMNRLTRDAENRLLKVEQNHLITDAFMIYLIIGGASEDLAAEAGSSELMFIDQKVKKLVQDSRTCVAIDMPPYEPDVDGDYAVQVRQMIEDILQLAADDHVQVRSLNMIRICPVVIASSQQSRYISAIIRGVADYAAITDKMLAWQPFMLVENQIDVIINTRASFLSMREFVMGENNCARCCILSDLDSNGFSVDREANLNTVVMASILHVVANDGNNSIKQSLQYVLFPNIQERSEWCYTAKNITVSLPICTLTLRRLASSFSFYYEKDHRQNNVWQRLPIPLADYLKPYLASLPHEQEVLTTWPLYALRRLASDKEFEAFANLYYIQPLNQAATLADHRRRLRKLILKTFFAYDGSLKELFSLDEEMRKKVIEQQKYVLPVMPPPRIADKLQPVYQKHVRYDEWLREWLQGYGRKMLQDVMMGDDFSVELPRQAGELAQRVSRMMQAVANRIRKHEASEIVTIIRETDLAGSLTEDTERWFRDLLQKDNQPMIEANRLFNLQLLQILESGGSELDLLTICYDSIKDHQESRETYMIRLSEACGKNRAMADRIAKTALDCLVFPLRVAMADQEESVETLVIGNADNQLFEPLTKRLSAKQLLTEDKNRIEILRVSKPFAHDQCSIYQD